MQISNGAVHCRRVWSVTANSNVLEYCTTFECTVTLDAGPIAMQYRGVLIYVPF